MRKRTLFYFLQPSLLVNKSILEPVICISEEHGQEGDILFQTEGIKIELKPISTMSISSEGLRGCLWELCNEQRIGLNYHLLCCHL
jgi:hypothetical protein